MTSLYSPTRTRVGVIENSSLHGDNRSSDDLPGVQRGVSVGALVEGITPGDRSGCVDRPVAGKGNDRGKVDARARAVRANDPDASTNEAGDFDRGRGASRGDVS